MPAIVFINIMMKCFPPSFPIINITFPEHTKPTTSNNQNQTFRFHKYHETPPPRDITVTEMPRLHWALLITTCGLLFHYTRGYPCQDAVVMVTGGDTVDSCVMPGGCRNISLGIKSLQSSFTSNASCSIVMQVHPGNYVDTVRYLIH